MTRIRVLEQRKRCIPVGTSARIFKPIAKLLVMDTGSQAPVENRVIQQVIQAAYDKSPWLVDGQAQHLWLDFGNFGTVVDTHHYALELGVVGLKITTSQYAAFEAMCRRVASALVANASDQAAPLARMVILDVSYEVVRREIFATTP